VKQYLCIRHSLLILQRFCAIESPVKISLARRAHEKIVIEQSSKAFDTAQSGLVLVGELVNGSTSLCERLDKRVPGRPRISHLDVVKTSLGLLCQGKSDFEAAAGLAGDDGFREALGIQNVPSQETLRQRFDR